MLNTALGFYVYVFHFLSMWYGLKMTIAQDKSMFVLIVFSLVIFKVF